MSAPCKQIGQRCALHDTQHLQAYPSGWQPPQTARPCKHPSAVQLLACEHCLGCVWLPLCAAHLLAWARCCPCMTAAASGKDVYPSQQRVCHVRLQAHAHWSAGFLTALSCGAGVEGATQFTKPTRKTTFDKCIRVYKGSDKGCNTGWHRQANVHSPTTSQRQMLVAGTQDTQCGHPDAHIGAELQNWSSTHAEDKI